MKQLKVILLAIFGAILLFACTDRGKGRFVISESKAYPASLFRQNCAICHGPEADGKTLMDGTVVPGLREGEFKYKSDHEIYNHISDGGNGMVPFRTQLTDREIKMLVEFVQKDLRRK
ncbi:MAG TPA: cytochrome c [Pyrinomonadaceae bacterium]|nr:cytochrome c [Pyrinomonadaceae bacterium]